LGIQVGCQILSFRRLRFTLRFRRLLVLLFPRAALNCDACAPVAERIGVNAEPECVVKEISPETECIVLASDGVFEFLSSQMVIDIVRFRFARWPSFGLAS
jgi:serine/threonine protein phosphatase PrpC